MNRSLNVGIIAGLPEIGQMILQISGALVLPVAYFLFNRDTLTAQSPDVL